MKAKRTQKLVPKQSCPPKMPNLKCHEYFLPVKDEGKEYPEAGSPAGHEESLGVAVIVHLPGDGEIAMKDAMGPVQDDRVHTCRKDTQKTHLKKVK